MSRNSAGVTGEQLACSPPGCLTVRGLQVWTWCGSNVQAPWSAQASVLGRLLRHCIFACPCGQSILKGWSRCMAVPVQRHAEKLCFAEGFNAILGQQPTMNVVPQQRQASLSWCCLPHPVPVGLQPSQAALHQHVVNATSAMPCSYSTSASPWTIMQVYSAAART